jgi:hypothetical protein
MDFQFWVLDARFKRILMNLKTTLKALSKVSDGG